MQNCSAGIADWRWASIISVPTTNTICLDCLFLTIVVDFVTLEPWAAPSSHRRPTCAPHRRRPFARAPRDEPVEPLKTHNQARILWAAYYSTAHVAAPQRLVGTRDCVSSPWPIGRVRQPELQGGVRRCRRQLLRQFWSCRSY